MRENEGGGAYSTNERKGKCIQIFYKIPERKIPLERQRSRWEDNIKIALI
jgi:hypothetical protein